jgi:hypothetical protein
VTAELEFLSPDRAGSEAVWRSPLERALHEAPATVRDVSRTGKLEVRGAVDTLEGAIRITDRRALVLCDYGDLAVTREQLRSTFLVLDVTAALAGLELVGEAVLRRLTDLDLDDLPAVGPVAGVQAYVLREGDDRFQIFFPQEYGDYVAEVVLDALAGLS